MKFIKLKMITRDGSLQPLYLNVEHIGSISKHSIECYINGSPVGGVTNVGSTVHNNGGFRVKETPEEILKLIRQK